MNHSQTFFYSIMLRENCFYSQGLIELSVSKRIFFSWDTILNCVFFSAQFPSYWAQIQFRTGKVFYLLLLFKPQNKTKGENIINVARNCLWDSMKYIVWNRRIMTLSLLNTPLSRMQSLQTRPLARGPYFECFFVAPEKSLWFHQIRFFLSIYMSTANVVN